MLGTDDLGPTAPVLWLRRSSTEHPELEEPHMTYADGFVIAAGSGRSWRFSEAGVTRLLQLDMTLLTFHRCLNGAAGIGAPVERVR